jgi:hypothetical protein
MPMMLTTTTTTTTTTTVRDTVTFTVPDVTITATREPSLPTGA